jgi:hypothetical protein
MQSDRPPPAFVLRSCNRWTGDTTDRTCEAAQRGQLTSIWLIPFHMSDEQIERRVGCPRLALSRH